MIFTFDSRTGRYRNRETGVFVSRAQVLLETEKEQARLETRLKGTTRLLLQKKITLAEWETRMAQQIKRSHLRMAALGAGGEDKLTSAHMASVGGMMKGEYGRLHRFAQEIRRGEHTKGYILNRAGLYGASTRRSFYAAEQISRRKAGSRLAKRVLDPLARHCRQCPTYATVGYVPIETIVPPGQQCDCGGRCRCQILYKPAEVGPRILDLSDRFRLVSLR